MPASAGMTTKKAADVLDRLPWRETCAC